MASRKNKCKASEDTSKLIRENMKCPVCMEVLLPPIYQCETGHNICYLCVDEVSECPLCKGDYGDTRNYFAEELVNSMSFACKFEDYGCTKTLLGKELKDHQECCEFQPYRCPELACQEVCGLHQMGKHLDRHGFKVMKGDVQQANIDIQDDHFDRKTEYNPWRIFAFNREFYTVSTRQKSGTWYFWCYCLGLPKDTKKFSCEIVVFSEGKQVLYRGVVHSLRTQPEDIMEQGNCLILTDESVKSMRRNGKISCRVRFIQGKCWDAKVEKPKKSSYAKGAAAKDWRKNPQKGKTRVLATATPTTSALTSLRPSGSTATLSKVPVPPRPSTARMSSSSRVIPSSYPTSSANISKREKSSTSCLTPRSCTTKGKIDTGVASSTSREYPITFCPSRTRARSRSSGHIQIKVSDDEQNFVMKMRDTLRCPGCQEIISPPVHQCVIGHNCCHLCKMTRSDCAVCRAPIGSARNFFAEEMLYKVYQRCGYANLGCQVCLPSAQMRLHESTCDFAPFECPFNACRKQVGPHELLDHLKSHQIDICNTNDLKTNLDVPKQSPATGSVCAIPSILLAYNNTPFFPVIFRKDDGSWNFFVTTQEPNQYRFEVSVERMCKILAYQGPVLSLRKNQTEIERNGACLVLTENMVKSMKYENKLTFSIKIYRNSERLPAESPFAFHASLADKPGTVMTKTELFANKKTSVSADEDEDFAEAGVTGVGRATREEAGSETQLSEIDHSESEPDDAEEIEESENAIVPSRPYSATSMTVIRPQQDYLMLEEIQELEKDEETIQEGSPIKVSTTVNYELEKIIEEDNTKPIGTISKTEVGGTGAHCTIGDNFSVFPDAREIWNMLISRLQPLWI